MQILTVTLLHDLTWAKSQDFLPKGSCPRQLEYEHYTVCYSFEHRQAIWTKHELTQEMLKGKEPRRNRFRADERLPDPVGADDYRGSGFDRGHMVPAADMKLNALSMSETFYMTNMSPQNPQLNRNLWASIENRIRSQVRRHGTAHIVTAPVLRGQLMRIDSGVSIPEHYYKVAYFPSAGFMEAYLVENRPYEKTSIQVFQVAVRDVEELAGLDFFADLPDSLEDQLESTPPLAAQQ